MRIPRPGASAGVPAIGIHDAVSATEAQRPIRGGEATGPVAAASARPLDEIVADLARRLRSGDLDAHAAVSLLIDDTIAKQLGPDTLQRQRLATELKQILQRCADTDPHLVATVKRLGKHL